MPPESCDDLSRKLAELSPQLALMIQAMADLLVERRHRADGAAAGQSPDARKACIMLLAALTDHKRLVDLATERALQAHPKWPTILCDKLNSLAFARWLAVELLFSNENGMAALKKLESSDDAALAKLKSRLKKSRSRRRASSTKDTPKWAQALVCPFYDAAEQACGEHEAMRDMISHAETSGLRQVLERGGLVTVASRDGEQILLLDPEIVLVLSALIVPLEPLLYRKRGVLAQPAMPTTTRMALVPVSPQALHGNGGGGALAARPIALERLADPSCLGLRFARGALIRCSSSPSARPSSCPPAADDAAGPGAVPRQAPIAALASTVVNAVYLLNARVTALEERVQGAADPVRSSPSSPSMVPTAVPAPSSPSAAGGAEPPPSAPFGEQIAQPPAAVPCLGGERVDDENECRVRALLERGDDGAFFDEGLMLGRDGSIPSSPTSSLGSMVPRAAITDIDASISPSDEQSSSQTAELTAGQLRKAGMGCALLKVVAFCQPPSPSQRQVCACGPAASAASAIVRARCARPRMPDLAARCSPPPAGCAPAPNALRSSAGWPRCRASASPTRWSGSMWSRRSRRISASARRAICACCWTS